VWAADNSVTLGKGLEEIDELVLLVPFSSCIVIPPAVKAIKVAAFSFCTQLTTVRLEEGLEEIGIEAFDHCTSLHGIVIHDINIPPTFKSIKCRAFAFCTQLTTVNLWEGLEEIGDGVFWSCTSLQLIVIPRAVTLIHNEAFKACSQLTNVEFCKLCIAQVELLPGET
jgi:hypothetical protein